MKHMTKRLCALVFSLYAVAGAGAQTFYICQDGDTEAASEIAFTDNGNTLNGHSTSAIDSITTHIPALRFVGGDLSLLTKYEAQRAKYKDRDGKAISDLLTYVKEQGWNTIRVRLMVDPTKVSNQETNHDQWVVQDLDYVKALGARIKAAGLLFLLDFHYSDTWADPAAQWTPDSWLSLSDTQLQEQLYVYTCDCLLELCAAGAAPDFIQTGNEISYGMLWGKEGTAANRCLTSSSEASWSRFFNFLKPATRACREVCPRAKIIIHSERTPKPSVLTDYYNRIKNAGIDYDIIGLSYYPYFHGNLDVLDTALKTLQNKKYGKAIQIVETGYPWKWKVDGTTYEYTGTYPYTNAGQKAFTAALISTLKKYPEVNGLSWWFAEANAYGITTGDLKNKWYNAGLFDNQTGKALEALYELKNFK